MRRSRLTPAVVGAAAIAVLALPAPALAHVANIEYKFPLPIWLYAAAGAVAVVLSVPAATFALRRRAWVGSRNLYPLLARVLPGPFVRVLGLALLALVILGGFLSPALGVENPAVLLVWVVLWVGLGLVSSLIGNVWDLASPLSRLARSLDASLARRGTPTHAYPDALGAWPAVFLLLAFSWAELVWVDSRNPPVLAALVLGYCVVQLAGAARYGAEVWLARAELFTVVARAFARVAPVELYALPREEPCSARRCAAEGERVGCPSCFLEAPAGARGVRLRSFGSGILREPPLGAGGGAFVVVLLATVVYDGLRGTRPYGRFVSDLVDLLPRLDEMRQLRGTLMLILVVGAFALVYLLASWLASLLEDGGVLDIAGRYAPTLIPIAAVYFIAHYTLYLFYVGQLTPRVVLDPTDSGWIGEYQPWTAIPGAAVWVFQLTAIVGGHILAVVAAHRVAAPYHRSTRSVLGAQLPLLALMVLYTFTGLWVLGQALQRAG